MFGSRLGRGVSLGVVSAMMVGMLSGCPGDKPDDGEKTPEQIAAGLIAEAEIAVANDKTDEAEKLVEEAVKAFADIDVSVINEKIAAKKEAIDTAEKKKKVNAFIADGKALLGADPAAAKAKGLEALAIDPDCAPAQKLVADAEAAIAASKEPDAKALYAKAKARFDSAVQRRQWSSAISAIADVEKWAPKGGPSIASQRPKLEANQLVDEARPLVRSDSESQIRRGISKLDAAARKDPANRDISTLKRQAESKLRGLGETVRAKKEYSRLMAEGRSAAKSNSIPSLEGAARTFDKAERIARDSRSKDAAKRAAKEVREKITYRRSMDSAKQALGRGALDDALRNVKAAILIRSTSEARDLKEEIQGAVAVGAADVAEKAGDWDEAVRQLRKADSYGVDVAAALARAQKQLGDIQLTKQITALTKAGEALEFGPFAAEAAALGVKHPDNERIKSLLAKYPLRAEAAKINKAAVPVYKAAMAAAKKVKPDRRQEKIEVYESYLPKLAGSRYAKTIESMIERERTGIFSGQWTKVRGAATGIKDLTQKISYLEGERSRFEGTSFLKQIDAMITAAKTQKAAKAFGALNVSVKKIKPTDYDTKISTLESAVAQPVYADTRYVTNINSMVTAAKNARAAGAHRALTVSLKKIKPAQIDQKISTLESALTQPIYEGTRYKDMIAASIKREKDTKARKPFAALNARVAKAKTPQDRLAILEGDVNNAIYAGTSLKDQINRSIDTQKGAIKTAEFKAVSARVRDPKMSADAKIAYLTSQTTNFAGSRYEKQIASMITCEKNAKMAKAFVDLRARMNKIKTPQLKIVELTGAKDRFAGTRYDRSVASMITAERNILAAKKYGDLMKSLPKLPPLEVISRLEAGAQDPEIVGSKYEGIIKSRITKEKTLLKGKQYKALMTTMNDPKAKRDSAAKAEFLRSRKADFTGTTYAATIDRQIKGFEGRIAAEKKAAAAKGKAAAVAAEKKRKADEARAAAAARKKADVAASKVYSAVLKSLKPAKTVADCDANIQKLVDAKQQVVGSSYVAKLDGQIASQRKIKAKLAKANK